MKIRREFALQQKVIYVTNIEIAFNQEEKDIKTKLLTYEKVVMRSY